MEGHVEAPQLLPSNNYVDLVLWYFFTDEEIEMDINLLKEI